MLLTAFQAAERTPSSSSLIAPMMGSSCATAPLRVRMSMRPALAMPFDFVMESVMAAMAFALEMRTMASCAALRSSSFLLLRKATRGGTVDSSPRVTTALSAALRRSTFSLFSSLRATARESRSPRFARMLRIWALASGVESFILSSHHWATFCPLVASAARLATERS